MHFCKVSRFSFPKNAPKTTISLQNLPYAKLLIGTTNNSYERNKWNFDWSDHSFFHCWTPPFLCFRDNNLFFHFKLRTCVINTPKNNCYFRWCFSLIICFKHKLDIAKHCLLFNVESDKTLVTWSVSSSNDEVYKSMYEQVTQLTHTPKYVNH